MMKRSTPVKTTEITRREASGAADARGPADGQDAMWETYNNRFFDASPLNGWVRFEASEGFAIRYINPCFVRMLGYESREALFARCGGSYAALIHPEDGAHDALEAVVRMPVGGSRVATCRLVTSGGGALWVREMSHKYIDVDGTPMLLGLCIDITESVELAERLRVSEEEMRLAMAQMGKMVCVYDVSTHTLTMPEAYAQKHGLPETLPNVPQNAQTSKVLGEQSRAAFIHFFEAILRGDKTGATEVYLTCADGSACWERGEFAAIFDAEGKPIKAIVAVEDITQQRLQEDETEALRESERLFRAVATHSSRLIYHYDIANKMAYAEGNAAQRKHANAIIAGANLPEDAIERGAVLPESVEDFRRIFREIQEGRPEGSVKLHMLDANGLARWLDMRYSLVDAERKTPQTAVLSFQDVTDTHERELAYERYNQRMKNETLSERLVYFETDLTTDVVEKQGGNIPNVQFPASGCRHEDAVRYGIEHLLPPDAREQAWQLFSREHLLTAFAEGKRVFEQDLPAVLPGGEHGWFHAAIQMIQDPYSGHIKVYTSLHDVTQEITAALDVKRQAETDGMTGLYNKATTEALVRHRLATAGGERCCLLILDLDNLKSINDNLGHAQGDYAIRKLAETLRLQFRRTDIIGRIGGDEFLAFLDGVGDEKMLHTMLTAFMRRLATVFIGEKKDVRLRGSIGATLGTAGKDTFEELYRKADRALYHVKRHTKNDYAIYTPDMEETAYRHKAHDESSVWQVNSFERMELDRLLYAVSELYPMVISVNLTQNSYYMMRYNHYMTKSCFEAGVFDELIAEGTGTFHPDDRASFIAAFDRENLLAAHARGERVVSHVGRQLGDDGVYRRIRTEVIFVKNDGADVMEITLARELPPETDSPA